MNNLSPKNIFAPWLIIVALFLSFNAGALQQSGSMNRLIYACEQELQTYCGYLDDPKQALICSHENKLQLQTRACKNEVQDYRSSRNYVPEATEEPFIDNQTNEAQ